MCKTLLISLLLVGCATSQPIGKGGSYRVECNGLALTWSACFSKANQVCPKGYDVLTQQTEHGPYSGSVYDDGTGGVGAAGAPIYRALTVKCH